MKKCDLTARTPRRQGGKTLYVRNQIEFYFADEFVCVHLRVSAVQVLYSIQIGTEKSLRTAINAHAAVRRGVFSVRQIFPASFAGFLLRGSVSITARCCSCER